MMSRTESQIRYQIKQLQAEKTAAQEKWLEVGVEETERVVEEISGRIEKLYEKLDRMEEENEKWVNGEIPG